MKSSARDPEARIKTSICVTEYRGIGEKPWNLEPETRNSTVSQLHLTCDTVAEAQEVIERAILGALNELVGVDQGEAGETAH